MKDFLIFTCLALIASAACNSIGQLLGILPNYGHVALGTKVQDATPGRFYCSKDEPYLVGETDVQNAPRGVKFATDVSPGKG